MNRALFLDRDGVLNVDTGYVGNPDDLQIVPGVVDFLRKASALGYILVVVTNQSGIARGYFSEDDYAAVTRRLREVFSEHDITFAGIYHCPHHPDVDGPLGIDCSCRKPLPGMIEQAAADLNIDLGSSMMIGDKESDIEAASRAGVTSRILLPPQADQESAEELFSAATLMLAGLANGRKPAERPRIK